jgi:hypothetical protein
MLSFPGFSCEIAGGLNGSARYFSSYCTFVQVTKPSTEMPFDIRLSQFGTKPEIHGHARGMAKRSTIFFMMGRFRQEFVSTRAKFQQLSAIRKGLSHYSLLLSGSASASSALR